MAERGQNLIGRAQILIDRLGFRRRLNNDDIHVIPVTCGKIRGCSRGIRGIPFAPNMGSGGPGVKSTDVEMPLLCLDSLSQKLRNTSDSCVHLAVFLYSQAISNGSKESSAQAEAIVRGETAARCRQWTSGGGGSRHG